MGKKVKSISAVFMAICMVVTMSSTSLFMVVADAIEKSKVEQAQDVDDSTQEATKETQEEPSSLGWYDSQKDTFTIESEDDLVLLSRIVNGTAEDAGGNKVQDSFKGKTIVLSNDLDLEGVEITPIGTKENPFEGTFNGQNNKISNLNISSENDYQGLFGYNNGTIKKISLSGKVTGKNYVGGLVAVNEGTVQNINSNVTIKATEDYVGGVVGKNSGTVDRCKNSATIDARTFMGGIVGYNIATVKRCSNSGTINCWGTDCVYNTMKGAGGITGASYGEKDNIKCIISECDNTGKIYGHYDAGGITGWLQDGTVINCSNTAYVEGIWDAGGIAGALVHEGAYVKNCYNTGYVTVFKGTQNSTTGTGYSYKYSGGIAGFIWSGHIDNCYNSGDVYSIEQGGGIFGGDYYQAGGSVSNCRTVGKVEGLSYIGNVFGWSGGVTIGDNKYYEKNDDNYNTIVSLLNAQVTSENGYKGWNKIGDNIKFSTSYDVEFNVKPSDAKIIVKDSEGNQMTEEERIFSLVNGTYTYEVSADGYITKKSSFEINGTEKTIDVNLLKNDQALSGEDTSWYNNEKNEFTLNTANEFAGLLKLVKEGNDFTGKTINLSNSISLENSNWSSIGNESNQFNGKFDGKGSVISNLDADLFGYIGEKGSVQNIGIEGTGAIATVNKGTIANSYALTSANIAKTNNGTVTNTYTNGKSVIGEGTDAVDSYAIDGETYKEEDLTNSKIANLLNKNVNAKNNSYYSWEISKEKTVLVKSYNATFKLTGENGAINDATITLYDKDNNEINADSSKNFMTESNVFRLTTGKYSYIINSNGYVTKKGTLRINSENKTVNLELESAYKITFEVDPSDATVIVKDSKNKVIDSKDGVYLLEKGDYTYEVSKEGYWTEKGKFTATKNQNISIKLVQTYDVIFKLNVENPEGLQIKVMTEDKEEVTSESDKLTYKLKNGKYTYTISTTEYKEVTGEIQVDGQAITQEINLEASYDTSWYDSTKDSFTITNGSQLAGLAVLVNGVNSNTVNFAGKTITLANDISLSKEECYWLPIGKDTAHSFKGTFDGDNHAIKDLNLNLQSKNYIGLFGYINSAVLKNITVEGKIEANNTIGALVASSDNSTIENCINKADIFSTNGRVAGLVGTLTRSYVKNCINMGSIESKEVYSGGVVAYGNSESSISNCANKGSVKSTANECGGIIGRNNEASVIDCINEGNIQGFMYVGGIAGKQNASLENCYNTGTVTASSKAGSVYVGGIVGTQQSSSPYIANCYNLGNVITEGSMAGGIAGSSAGYNANKPKLYNCYNMGNISASSNKASIVGSVSAASVYDCYYLDTTETSIDTTNFGQNGSKTIEEFKNGTVANLLNKYVKADNNFKLWKVVDDLTTFTDEKVNLSFNVSPQDAIVTLKDSDGKVVPKINENNNTYMNLNENEKYTYEVKCDTYITQTKEFTYNGQPTAINVNLEYISTDVSFKSNVENTQVKVYDNKDKLIEPNEKGVYTLLPGEYYYSASVENCGPIMKKFTVEPVKEATPMEINIEMSKGCEISFKSNATTKLEVILTNSEGFNIPLNENNTVLLSNGTYNYKAYADGFEDIEGELKVEDSKTVSLEMKRIYDVDWYDKDKTEFTLNTKEELIGLAKITGGETRHITKDTFAGKTIKLGKNIELNSKDLFTKDENGNTVVSTKVKAWTSIPTFAGTFDGCDHSIDGLYGASLFNSFSGTLKNLTTSGYIKLTMMNLSSMVRSASAGARIENCINKCEIVSAFTNSAGICARAVNATIINCVNKGNISGKNTVSGICGNGINATIINCVNEGNVTGSNGVSGISGATGNITNCYNLGDVTGTTAAGISTATATINNCVNYGKVTGTTSEGAISNTAIRDSITNSYYLKNSCSQGVVGDDVEGKVEAKSSKELGDGSVATLLNANVTKENDYKSWTVIDGKTVFGSYDLSINPSVTGATVKLYDYKGNEIKAITGTTGVFDGLRKGSLYKYEVTKEGLNTETGTVIMGSTPQTIYVELTATVYVTVSKDGEFKLADDQDTKLTRIAVTTTNFDVTDYGYPSVYNNESYPTLLNVFIRFHELYAGGADNFAGTPNNNPAKGNDLFVTKFLGIETTQLNYYVNNKYPGEWLEDQGYIWGSAADYIKMKNNDDVNVTMFTNYQTPMFYTYFDKQEATVKQGQDLELTLKGFNNADAYLAPESKNISGSTIYIDGEETETVTDKDGKATLTFDEPGTYIISAQGTDLSLSDSEETVITAPVCEVTVTEADDITVSFDADNGSEVVTKAMKPGKVLNYMPTAPTKNGYTFVGWYKDTDDITTEYKQGSRFTQSTTYKAKYAHVTMLGAQGKMVSNGKSGIRFGTKIYNDGDEIVEKGTLILPVNLLAEGEALTLETPNVAKSVANTLYEVNKAQNYVTYLGTIVNIPKAQFERQMTASAYVIYKDKAGHEYTVYAPYANGSISVMDLLGNDINWGEDW